MAASAIRHAGLNGNADFDGQGNVTYRYLYGPAVDMIMARLGAEGDIAWYLGDHLGTVRDLADTSGQVIDHIAYDSFGGILLETNPAVEDRFKFTAREFHAGIEQYYYRARYYDGRTGRFTSEDPLGLATGDANVFRYVGNQPTMGVDPTGAIRAQEIPGSAGAGPNGQFSIQWTFALDRPYNFDVVVIQHFRVRPVNIRTATAVPGPRGEFLEGQRHWESPWLEEHAAYEYYEVLGIVRGTQPQPDGGGLINRYKLQHLVRREQELRDRWAFGGRLLGEEASAGTWELSGEVRVIRLTEEVAKYLSKRRGIGGMTLTFVSEGERRRVPWSSGDFPGDLKRPAWFDTGEIVERQEVQTPEGQTVAVRRVTVNWGYEVRRQYGRPVFVPQPGTITRNYAPPPRR